MVVFDCSEKGLVSFLIDDQCKWIINCKYEYVVCGPCAV